MNPDYSFLDTLHCHSIDPDTFPIPSEELKRSVRIGDVVTIGIVKKANSQTDEPVFVETLRVRIDGVNWPMFDAVALIPLDLQKYHGVRAGDTVCFEEHHVMDVLNSRNPYAKQKSVANAQFTGISREFLEQVSPSDLSRNRTTITELDEFVTVLIKLKGNGVEVMVAVDVNNDERYNALHTETSAYSKRFCEAANQIKIPNVPPDLNNPNPIRQRNQLILQFEVPPTGRELIETIYATIAMVHKKAEAIAKE